MRLEDDDGTSLIEILLAIMILGTGVTAILAMLATGINISGVHRSYATGETITRQVTEGAKNMADYVTTSGAKNPCPDASSLAPAAPPSSWTFPTPVTVRYWLPTSNTWGTQNQCKTEYTAICGDDPIDCDAARSIGSYQEVSIALQAPGDPAKITTIKDTTRVYTRRGIAEETP